MPMLHLAAMREVPRVRKRRNHLSILGLRRVPPAVVEVQVGVDDNIDLVHRDPGGREGGRQLLLRAEDLPHFPGKLVADARLDDHGMLPGADHDGVRPQQDPVQLVGRRTPLPQRLRHHPEHRPAVEEVRSVGQNRQLEIAERRPRPHQIPRVRPLRRMGHGTLPSGAFFRYVSK